VGVLGTLGKTTAPPPREKRVRHGVCFLPRAYGNPVLQQEVLMFIVQFPCRTRKAVKKRKTPVPPAVSAERVREMLHEIAFVLHATRVIGRRETPVRTEDDSPPRGRQPRGGER
jgi:hypothetical protein